MGRAGALLGLAMLLAGCGIAETATTAAGTAESAAQQAAQARATQESVRHQIDAAYRQAESQRRAADTDGQ